MDREYNSLVSSYYAINFRIVKLGDSEEKCSCWYTMKEYTLAPVAERFLRVRRKVLCVCLALLRQPSPTIKCAILWETNILFKLFRCI